MDGKIAEMERSSFEIVNSVRNNFWHPLHRQHGDDFHASADLLNPVDIHHLLPPSFACSSFDTSFIEWCSYAMILSDETQAQ